MALLKSHLPSNSTAEVNDISTVPLNRSLTAKAMTYRLVVDRRFGFLYTAKQTRLFPIILVMLIAKQTLASVITTPKLRFGNSRLDIFTS